MGGFVFPNNPGGHVALTVPLAMFLWIPVIVYLFTRFPARKAVVISFIVAWLFLPEANMQILGIPDFNKMSATCYGILIATFIFDSGRFTSFRFSWLDIPMIVWCLCPYASSLTNDLGLYDGFSSSLQQTMSWGIPYFLGRIYLNSLGGLTQMAKAIFIGGLVYVPLCLIEMRLSPQLHRIVYGDHAHGFSQTLRLGGFRPTVFMETGLALAAFMMAATLAGLWLWQSRQVRQIWNIPIEWLVAIVFITFVLVRSSGALVLFSAGLLIYLAAVQFRTALPIYLIIISIAVYLYINTQTTTYFTDQLMEVLTPLFPAERLQSLQFRFDNEELLTDHARERWLWGWGGWGRSRVLLNEWGQLTIQDSLWVIAYGIHGIVGLVSVFASMLLPVSYFYWTKYPASIWLKPKVAGASVLGVIIVLYAVDCILNAMINPMYILACGGIAGLAIRQKESVNQVVSGKLASVQRRLTPQ